MSTVARNIRRIRLQKKMTQEEMAERLFVTRQTVSSWENGKSKPDIDTLVKIAETLHTDAAVLLYGPQDSGVPRKEKIRFIIAGGILLALGLAVFFYAPYAKEQFNTYYLNQPLLLLQLYLLPLLWLLAGWTIMQGLFVTGVVRLTGLKYGKVIRIAVLAVVLAYAAIMLPYLIYLIDSWVQLLQYLQNPSLYPNGFHYTSDFLGILNAIYPQLIELVYRQPVLFVIPGIVYRLCRPVRREGQA